MKFKIEIDKMLAQKLGAAIETISSKTKAAAEGAMAGVARQTLEKAKEMAFNRLNTTAQSYAEALTLTEISPGIFAITLRGEQAHLETGYSPFDQKPGLLKRATKVSKEGYKYRSIPMQQGGPGSGRIKQGSTRGDMLSDLKRLRKVFGDKGVTTSPDGTPVKGKVFSITRDDVGRWNLKPNKGSGLEPKSEGQMQASKNLSGVTKYQYQEKLKNGGFRTKTAFITYRTVSANPKYSDKWRHPGFAGAKIFPELEKWAMDQISKRMDEILK